MKNIEINSLKTHQLADLFEQKWFDKELQHWKNNAPQSSLFDELTFEGILEENLEVLVKEGEYFSAAKLLQSYDLYNDIDEKIMPLHWAVMNDSIELVMALLALGEDINQQDYECDLHVLPLAMMYGGEEMFNFLLLHPDISVHHEGKFIKEDADIMQFLGEYDVHYYIYPALRLLKPEYHACHQYLDIDWNFDYKPDYLPLMVYGFENYDFETMNMLVAKGADINPSLGEDSDVGPNLINWALERYRDIPTDKNKQGIQWFSRFTKLLASDSYEFSSLAEENVDWDDNELKNELGVKYFENLRKKYEELEKEFECYEKKLKKEYSISQPSNECYPSPDNIEVSILNDLIREKRVIPCDSIRDIKFSRIRNKIWIAVYFNDEPYPLSVSLPKEFIKRYSGNIGGIDLFSATEFHSIFWFIKADAMIFYCIEALANQHDRKVFSIVDDQSVVSGEERFFICSLIKSSDLFVDDTGSSKFLSIIDRVAYAERLLVGVGEIKDYKLYEDIVMKADDFEFKSDKVSIIIADRNTCSESQDEEYYFYIKNEDDWMLKHAGSTGMIIDLLMRHLFDVKLLSRCDECGEPGLASDMAYGETHHHCM